MCCVNTLFSCNNRCAIAMWFEVTTTARSWGCVWARTTTLTSSQCSCRWCSLCCMPQVPSYMPLAMLYALCHRCPGLPPASSVFVGVSRCAYCCCDTASDCFGDTPCLVVMWLCRTPTNLAPSDCFGDTPCLVVMSLCRTPTNTY